MTYRQAQARAGKAGRGKCKARTREQMRAAARVRWDRVRAEQAAKQPTEKKGE